MTMIDETMDENRFRKVSDDCDISDGARLGVKYERQTESQAQIAVVIASHKETGSLFDDRVKALPLSNK